MKRNKATQVLSAAAALTLTATTLVGGMTVSASEGTSVPAFEDIEFPDALPASPTLAEEDWYAYDDMSVHYDLSFMTDNYGYQLPEDDPIKAWLEKKYNVTLKLETVASQADMENFISTTFAGGDAPDLFTVPTKEMGFTLGSQGLLVDGRDMYPYMPQTCKFVTKTMIQFSTMEDGSLPFVTKYAILDSDLWNIAIRKDWLENLGMEMPTTEEELLEYGRAVTFNDPDGNGVDDTYFTLAASGGANLGMLRAFDNAFGNPYYYLDENGVVVDPVTSGNRKKVLEFCNKIYSEGLMPVDWYSIDWEAAKAYTLNDKIGMVRYPVGNLYGEYLNVRGGVDTLEEPIYENWVFLPNMPFEDGKGPAGGTPGYKWAIPKANVEGDEGKLMRICHILDAMCIGGEAYNATVQGGGPEVFEGMSDVNIEDCGERYYDEETGMSVMSVPLTHPGYNKYGTDNLVLATWQNFGYTTKYQVGIPETEKQQIYSDFVNAETAKVMSMDRWENLELLYTLPADIQPALKEFVNAQEYKFVVGERSLDDYDNYVQEWLDQGGRENIKAVAEQLGGQVPEGIE